MNRFFLVGLLAFGVTSLACGGSDAESIPCGDEMNLVEDVYGKSYCMPDAGSGKALCVLEPAEAYDPCQGGCGSHAVRAVVYHPWVDGSSETDCRCLPPEEAAACNGPIDVP